MKSEKSSQRGACYFPTQRCPKPTVPGPKTATVLARDRFCFGYSEACSFCVSPPSLADWWRLIVQSEKAKHVRAFSSLISQVQSSSLGVGTTYGVKRNERWPRKRATGGLFKGWQQVRGYQTWPSSSRHVQTAMTPTSQKHWLKTSYLDPPWRLCRSNCSFATCPLSIDGDNLIEKSVSCGVCVLSPPAGNWLMSEVRWEMTALICLFHRHNMSSSFWWHVLCTVLQGTQDVKIRATSLIAKCTHLLLLI